MQLDNGIFRFNRLTNWVMDLEIKISNTVEHLQRYPQWTTSTNVCPSLRPCPNCWPPPPGDGDIRIICNNCNYLLWKIFFAHEPNDFIWCCIHYFCSIVILLIFKWPSIIPFIYHQTKLLGIHQEIPGDHTLRRRPHLPQFSDVLYGCPRPSSLVIRGQPNLCPCPFWLFC